MQSVSFQNKVTEDLNALVGSLLLIGKDDIEKIILFGSFATGKYQPDSDYDLCVVLKHIPQENSLKMKYRNIAEACNIDREVDVVLCTEEQLQRGEHVYKYIKRDGVLLYGRL